MIYNAARAEVAPDAAFHKSIEQLRTVQQSVAQGNWAEAKALCSAMIQTGDTPAHHQWEAEERLKEIERLEKGLPARDPAAGRLPTPQRPKPAVTLFVAPNGNDSKPGTQAEPFQTLERARDAIRALRPSDNLPAGGVEVVIRGGEYKVTKTFELGPEDSGTEQSPIVYRAADGENPRFDGGVRLQDFQPVTDAQVLERLPEEARGKVLCVDLKTLGVGEIKPLELGGFNSGRGFKTHPTPELFFDGRVMTLARWPNEGFVQTGEIIGATTQPAWGPPAGTDGRFKFEDDRMARWVGEKELWLHGYWCWDWADTYECVASVDSAKHEIALKPPFHGYGYRQGHKFYVLNALSELDMPGEWYLDRSTLTLYFWPPADLGKADVHLSLNEFPFVKMQQVSHVAVEGLTFEFGGGDAIDLRDGKNCRIAGCTVRHCGGNGIGIYGGSDNVIVSCDIYSLGRGGICIHAGDRKTLAPARCAVENCEIYDLSRIDRTYTPGIVLDGVGNRVAHNLIHDVPSSAIRVGGNDHVVEYNQVYRVVTESDDQGGIDMFGDPTFRGNVFRYNYWHHIGNWRNPNEGPDCGQCGIRLDDAISGVVIYGNVFQHASCGKVGFGGVQIHGGKDNIIDNNLFVDCESAVSLSPWDDTRWKSHVSDKFPSSNLDTDLYLNRYPPLARLPEDFNRNTIARSLVVRCNKFLHRDSQWIDLAANLETAENPGFRNEAVGDFQLPDASPAAVQIGFRPIPIDEIGLYVDAYRKTVPQRADILSDATKSSEQAD